MKRERSDQDLGLYLDEVVYPALFERLDSAFPEFGWERSGKGPWTATTWPAGFESGVKDKRPERLMVYEKNEGGTAYHRIKLHGHGVVRFLDLVNGGQKPTGPEFPEAVRSLCEKAGVPFPEREVSAEEVERRQKQEARRSALEVVTAYAQKTLFSPAGTAALSYLTRERGFTEDAVRELGLGFYDSTAKVRKALEEAGVTLKAAEEAALLWPKLEGYVLIPWADAMGHPLTLYGRWASKTLPTDGRPKTLALPGEGTKGSPLYFDRARRAGHRDLVAVEGVFDAALLQARGDSRVVAYVAAEFSGLQVETMVRHKVRSVVVCPDPDGGGDKGALSSVAALAKVGIEALVTPRLPDGLDPDEFLLREGLEGWKTHVSAAVSGPVYRSNVYLGNVSPESPDIDRHQAVDKVLSVVEGLRGPRASLDEEDVLKLTAERTGYTFETLGELAGDHKARRQKEDEERTLGELLHQASKEWTEGKNPREVVRLLSKGLVSIEGRTEDKPPQFSVDRLEAESRVLPVGKSSGWKNVDNLGVRFNAGELSLLAARTGHGKTSALVNLLLNWLRSSKGDELLVLYSMEEPEVRIFHRLLALLSVDLSTRSGWSPNEVRDFYQRKEAESPENLKKARNELKALESRLLVVFRPGWNVEKLRAHALNLGETRPVGAVLVDYLQRVPPPEGRYDRRDIEVSAVNRYLKSLAVGLSCPVVAGAQINRDAVPDKYRESLAEKGYEDAKSAVKKARPALNHVREGGSEQEADFVLGLLNYRADVTAEENGFGGGVPEETLFEVGTLKTRYEAPGKWAPLVFTGRWGLLRDPVSGEKP